MLTGMDEHLAQGAEEPRLGRFIREHRGRILEAWEAAVRALPVAGGLSRPRLMDHVPDLLEGLARTVESGQSTRESGLEGLPEVHALERLDAGFDLPEVAAEFALLRSCIHRLFRAEHGQARVPLAALLTELERLDQALDEAVVASVARYARARERTLVALDRISEAALESAEVDRFLPRLLGVLLETTAAVDSAAILLREDDTLRVRAALGFDEALARGLVLKVGEGFAGRVAAEARPLLLHSAATDPLVKSEAVRAAGTRALYGVPLLEGGQLVGVAHIGSRTAWDFSNEDKLLFRTMASRAAALLAQARLKERERTEWQRAERERARAEASLAQQAFFAEAGRALAAPMDVESTLRSIARLAVRGLADYCVLDLLGAHGQLRRLEAAAAPDLPHLEPLLRRALPHAPHVHGRSPLAEVLASGVPQLVQHVTPGWLDRVALDAEHREVLEALAPRSTALVPLVARGRTLGLLNLATVRRTFGPEDLEVARTVADHAAIALDNARLFEELRASEARLQAILDNSSAVIFMKDLEGHYLLANRAIEGLVGRPREEVLGRTDLELFEPSVAEVLRANDAEVLRTRTSLQYEEALPRPGGAHTYLTLKFPLLGPDGQVQAVCGMSTDITGRKQQEVELHRTAEFRERLLGIVSHDLRNPLNAISASASMLLRSEELPESSIRAVRRIVHSADRMARMIADLLDFTRGRLGGGIPITRAELDLRSTLEHVLEEAELAHPTRPGSPRGP